MKAPVYRTSFDQIELDVWVGIIPSQIYLALLYGRMR